MKARAPRARDESVCSRYGARRARRNGPRVLLVSGNPNVQAFVPPYGLELIAEALTRTISASVKIVDPFLRRPFTPSLETAFMGFGPDIVGIGIRNLDSWFKPVSPEAPVVGKSFIEDVRNVIDRLRRLGMPADRIIPGGAAFSIAPRVILRHLRLVYGIAGPGECTFPLLVAALIEGRSPEQIPGVVSVRSAWRGSPNGVTMGRDYINLDYVPSQDGTHRKIALLRNEAVPLRTRSGCGCTCCYCCEAVTQPRPARLRSLMSIEDEISAIKRYGLSRVFIADGEFNALSVAHCERVIRLLRRYEMNWRAYCLPVFGDGTVDLVRTSACEGLCLTIDSLSEKILAGIGHTFRREDIKETVDRLRRAKIAVQATLLFGLPGETRATIRETVDFVRTHQEVTFNHVCGVRVYPNTALHRMVLERGVGHVYGPKDGDFLEISLYSEPFPPWELEAHVAEELAGLPNVRAEFS